LIGGLSVIPVMGIAVAISLLSSPVRVLLDDRGLTIEWLIRRRAFLWNDISEIQLKKVNFSISWLGTFTARKNLPKERLLLLDSNGRMLAQIPASIKPFDVLTREIYSRTTAARGTPTFSAEKQTSREISSRKKQRIFLFLAGIFIAALGIAFGVISSVDDHNKRLLEKDGRLIEAAVVKHYIYNITPRLKYAFTAPDGREYSKDVMVDRKYWDSVEKDVTVPVRYLPANPDNNKLSSGQIEEFDLPLPLTIVISLVLTVFGLLCITMYFLQISDIKIENGRIRIVRVNQVELSQTVSSLTEPAAGSPAVRPPAPMEIEPSPPASAETYRRALPAGLKAIGILNIVLGSLGFLWNVGRLLLAYLIASNKIAAAENIKPQANLAWVFAGHGLASLIAVAFVISGIGILMFLNWARVLAVLAASAKLLLGVIEIISVSLSSPETAGTEQQYITSVVKVFYAFCVFLTMVYPLIVLVLLLRKSAREPFRSKQSP
jgi:hypothetical protein